MGAGVARARLADVDGPAGLELAGGRFRGVTGAAADLPPLPRGFSPRGAMVATPVGGQDRGFDRGCGNGLCRDFKQGCGKEKKRKDEEEEERFKLRWDRSSLNMLDSGPD